MFVAVLWCVLSVCFVCCLSSVCCVLCVACVCVVCCVYWVSGVCWAYWVCCVSLVWYVVHLVRCVLSGGGSGNWSSRSGPHKSQSGLGYRHGLNPVVDRKEKS